MSYKRYVDWALAIVIGIAIGALAAGPAHATEQVSPSLPSDAQSWGGDGAVYVVEDKARGVVCYETIYNHRVALACVKLRNI